MKPDAKPSSGTTPNPSRTPSSLPMLGGCFIAALSPWAACANPAGLFVQSGSATVVTSGSHLDITASHNAFLNWQSFNLAPGETTRFIQPSAASFVWNEIQDRNPSQILGRIEANGNVVLINRSGFYFGPDSFVSAAGLIVSTAPVVPVESSAGLFWQFNGAPPQASVINYGHLDAGRAGSLFLIGEHLENHGTLSAPEGNIGLLAAKEVLVSTRPDGRALSAAVRLPSGSVDNSGRLIADAGTIALQARVVNQEGLVQADSVREHNGVIELLASESVTLGSGSVLSARGDAAAPSDGGAIVIKSAGSFTDSATSKLDVSGGAQGGNSGFVEVSAERMSAIRSGLVGKASLGGTGGQLLIDPRDIVIGNSGTGSAGSGSVGAGDPPTAGALELDVDTAFVGFSQVTLQATRNITISAGTLWDLAASTGIDEPGSRLKLEAGNNISIANGASIVGGANWSVTLEAGRDLAAGTGALLAGVGNIAFNGTGSLATQTGDISLRAGNNVTVAGGHVRTTGGGDIAVHALAGNINSGTKANGFRFLPGSYQVDADLGGISTANGGDVSLTAGQDVISYLPLAGGQQSDAGSGAFGEAPGDVTIKAGRDVAGHFVVRNGDGTIEAGRNAGAASRLLALSVVDGGWSVSAENDILLQEVRNPNGLFNNLGSSTSANRHRFDYAADAYTILRAGHAVELRGTALPRFNDAFSQGMPPIYPGTLGISAGSGGVVLGNVVVLFPSPIGNLSIKTTDGGPLVGAKAGDLAQLIVSDSGKRQYRNFGDFGISDHAATPLHLDDSKPVGLDIAGDLTGVLLGVPKRAEIKVGGDLVNSRFDGQNLHANDVTSLHVAGDIINRNEFTSVPSTAKPDFSVFELGLIFPPLTGALAGLESRFAYNAASKTLTFQGRMTGDELQLLLNTPVVESDANGQPVFLPNGEPRTRLVQTLSPEVANQLYAASQDVPLNSDTGYRLGGGGTFDIRARDLDLGATVGIVSQGPRGNAALARYFTEGADIEVRLDGDLEMFSTKIASLNGGDITVVADGSVNVGSRTFTASDSNARGIFTVDASDVTVIARGNIDVNGSRIAGYDGGNVTVRSLEGNVDAGTGGSGSATVEKLHVDPVTRQIQTYSPTIPGSGILATTFPPSLDPAFPASQNTVGNILVETPRGDIVASAGGVVQIPLNGIGSSAGTVTLRAGSKDGAGNVIHQGDIDARGSGVIGSTVKLEATGDIQGLVFARENIDLVARQNVNVTALAQGSVSVGAGCNVSGTIIGVSSVNASGATVDAALLSQNISASGNVTSSEVGFGQANAAAGTSQGLQSEDPSKAVAAKDDAEDDTAKKRRLAGSPKLTRTVGRVTVILPAPTTRN